MKTNENQKSTNSQPATQKPFFGAKPEQTFFSSVRELSTPFFQLKADLGREPKEKEPVQRQVEDKEKPLQMKADGHQPSNSGSFQENPPNNTGLPDNLKAGIENLSGIGMDDVKVHYNSAKPSKLGALAYTQGSDIHVGIGQEKHLAHEAWHVVQQKQGRVQPTMQFQTTAINHNSVLEHEADVMGMKASRAINTVDIQENQNNLSSLRQRTSINNLDTPAIKTNKHRHQILSSNFSNPVQFKFPKEEEWKYVLGSSPNLEKDATLWVDILTDMAMDEVDQYNFQATNDNKVLFNDNTYTPKELFDKANKGTLTQWLINIGSQKNPQDDNTPQAKIPTNAEVVIFDYGDAPYKGIVTGFNTDGTYQVILTEENWKGTTVNVKAEHINRNSSSPRTNDNIRSTTNLDNKEVTPSKKANKNDDRGKGAISLLIVGSHMSGDMYGVAAALALRPDLRVLILSDKQQNHEKTKMAMAGLFKSVAGEQRVYIKDDLQNVNSQWKDYLKSDSWKDTNHPEDKFNPLDVTKETSIIVEGFTKEHAQTEKIIKDKWVGDGKGELEEGRNLTREFLDKKGIKPGKYALLWAKVGELSHPHAHHYSSNTSQKSLIEKVSESRTPITIGDKVTDGHETQPSLTKFWDDPAFPEKFKQEGRRGQLKFHYHFAHLEGYDVIHVGMRSGILEGPALLGLKVIYMEERGNAQAGRWEKLLELMPNFKRIILDAPPGASEKKLWIEKVLWRNFKSKLLQGNKRTIAQMLQVKEETEKNQLMQILLETKNLPDATDELIKNKQIEEAKKETIKLDLNRLLELAQKELVEKSGGEDVWKQKTFDELSKLSGDTKTGEGMSENEIKVLQHLLTQWEAEPNSDIANEFYKRTWLENKALTDYPRQGETNWADEHKSKKMLKDKKSREEIAKFRVENSDLETTQAVKKYEENLRKEIIGEFTKLFKPNHKKQLEQALTDKKIVDYVANIKCEKERLESGNKQQFDTLKILDLLGQAEHILCGYLNFSKQAVTAVLKNANNNLLAAYNILNITEKKVEFLEEFKDSELENKPLGEGKQKNVFLIKSYPDYVMGIMHQDKNDYFSLIHEEIDMLNSIHEVGLSTVKVIGITTHKGLPAIVMKKYFEHSKDFVAKNVAQDQDAVGNDTSDKYQQFGDKLIKKAKYLNEKSIKGLLEMEKLMIDKKIRIKDLQFLIDTDGSVVIADPGNVVKDKEPSNDEIGVIDNLITTTVHKIFLEKDNNASNYSESDLGLKISQIINIPQNNVKIKSILKILALRYKYQITWSQGQDAIKYGEEKASTPVKGKPKDAQQKPEQEKEKEKDGMSLWTHKILQALRDSETEKDKKKYVAVSNSKDNNVTQNLFKLTSEQFFKAFKALKDQQKIGSDKTGIWLLKND